MNRQRNRILRVVFQLLGVALFVVILTRVDLLTVGEAFRRIPPLHIVAGIGMLVLFTLVKGIRWRMIVAAQGIDMSVPRSFKIYASSLYLGLVTPGHIGDFAKAWYVRNAGLPVGRAVWSSVLDRMFDLAFLVIIAYVSLLGLPGIIANQIVMSTVVLACIAAIVAVCIFRRDLLKKVARRLFASTASSGLRYHLDRAMQEGIDDFGLVRPRLAWTASLATAAAWILHYAYFVLLADGLGIEISVLHVVVCVSVSIFVALIPVSISGLGTRDLALILIFHRIGLSREAAVTFSFTFISVFLVQGVIGFVCWLSAPFKPRAQPEAAPREEA